MAEEKALVGAYSWRTDYQLLGAGFAALLLLVAPFGDLGAGYYTFLRLYVTLAAGAVAWRSHRDAKVITAVVAAIVAILFNPLLPVELDKETWQPIDLVVGGWFSWLSLDGLASAKGKPLLRFAPIATAIALLGASLLVLAIGETQRQRSSDNFPDTDFNALVSNEAAIVVPPRTAEERLADAFEAATGHRAQFTETKGTDVIITKPLRIIDLPFGPALLTQREIKDGCHACSGAIGVFYLKEDGDQTHVTGSWPEAVEGWGWGAPPPEWHLTNKFTANPAIYASGGFMGQGIVEESATITELRPAGPITSDVIGTGFSDEGAIADNERPACLVEGKIANIRNDRSFDVIISGSVEGRDRYIKKGGKFIAVSKIDWGIPCPM